MIGLRSVRRVVPKAPVSALSLPTSSGKAGGGVIRPPTGFLWAAAFSAAWMASGTDWSTTATVVALLLWVLL